MNFSGSFLEREFGASASSDAIDLTGIQLRWFDRWLKELDNGVEEEAPVMIFVMGIDEWHTETDWPLPDTQYRPYYLHSGGQANTLHGDGTLSEEPPGNEPADVYLYNPMRPVPTVGGQVILPGGNAIGQRDQRAVDVRDDVLVCSTPVLSQPIEVIGPIELRLLFLFENPPMYKISAYFAREVSRLVYGNACWIIVNALPGEAIYFFQLHDLRHTAATFLIARGEHPRTPFGGT
jgi:putative CocE/NonD family hydrolase